jgi:hypothetical protein
VEAVIWVEILSRHREVTARHRFVASELRIGRGYDNDLVLDDPYVAAHHLRVYRSDTGELVAEDIGSANGLFRDGDPKRHETLRLDGNEVIRIGGVLLRLRDARYAVPRERVYGRQVRLWPAAAALTAAILALDALSLWLDETTEPKASRYVAALFGLVGMTLVWTAGWAVLSRVFAGRVNVQRVLVTALAGIFTYSLYGWLAQFAAYSLAWPGPVTYQYAAVWIMLGLVVFAHLQAIGARLHVAAVAVTALCGLAVAAQSLTQSELRANFGQQTQVLRLLPPALRLAPLQNEASFFAAVETLKAKLDHDRVEEEPGTADAR